MTEQEYQKAYTRRRSLARLAGVLAGNFETAVMLTFRYSGRNVPSAVTASQFRTLKQQACLAAGGPFRYVQTAMYDFSPAGMVPVFRLIVQLPASVCEKIAGNWFMGPVEVEAMTAAQLAAFVDGLAEQPPEAWAKHCATWTCSADLWQSRDTPVRKKQKRKALA